MKDYDQIALDIARKHTPDDDAQARAALQVDIINALKPANPRGVISLVEYIGDDDIKLQMIANSIDGQVKLVDKDRATKLTIITDSDNFRPEDVLTGKPRKIGMLLWLDPAKVEAWRKS